VQILPAADLDRPAAVAVFEIGVGRPTEKPFVFAEEQFFAAHDDVDFGNLVVLAAEREREELPVGRFAERRADFGEHASRRRFALQADLIAAERNLLGALFCQVEHVGLQQFNIVGNNDCQRAADFESVELEAVELLGRSGADYFEDAMRVAMAALRIEPIIAGPFAGQQVAAALRSQHVELQAALFQPGDVFPAQDQRQHQPGLAKPDGPRLVR
jgi:hypothetical protein